MRKILYGLAVAILVAACATGGIARRDELFARIEPGMTRAEVRALTGPPDNTMAFSMSRTDSGGWFYFDTWGYYCEFSVTFGPDGRVASKLSRRINDANDHGT